MKKLIFITGIIGVILALFFISQSLYASPDSSQWLVTPQWVKEHLNDQNLTIVYVSLNPQDYEKEHIPNSIYVDWKADLADKREKIHYEMVPKDDFEKLMSRIGATQDTTLIFYDNFNNRLALRALYVTAFYGHEKAAILEGGISSWKSAGFDTTHIVPAITSSNYSVMEIHSGIKVDKTYVEKNLRNKRVTFVDSRPWKMYTGETVGIMVNTGKEVARRGHLPGAINLPWKSNIDEKTMFLDGDTLMKMYREKGLKKGKGDIVFYCNEGVHGVFNWFVTSKILGFKNVTVYEGSMGEWAEDPLRPMVSGIGF